MNETNEVNVSEQQEVGIIKKYILPFLCVAGIIGIDQFTKYLTLFFYSKNLAAEKKNPADLLVLIDGVFRLFFVKNEGMAWGLLQNKQLVFIIITPIVVAGLVVFYYKMPFTKKYTIMRICVLFLAGGAIGNLIDRMFRGELFHGYVVDMIYVEIINFPVFNVADSFITVGFAILILSIIFVYKEKDFDVIFKKNALEESEESEEENEEVSEETKEENEDSSEEIKEEEKETSDETKTEENESDEIKEAEKTE